MSSFIRPFKHKETGEERQIFAIDDYFSPRVYGFKTPDGRVLTEEQFDKEYEELDK